MPHPRKICVMQYKTNQARHPPTKQDFFHKDKKEEIRRKTRKSRSIKAHMKEEIERSMTFEPPATVGGTRNIDIFPCCALLPFLPFLSYFSPPRFPFYSCCPPCPHSSGRASFYSSCCPPFPLFLWVPTTHSGCAVLPTQLSLILVPPYHEPFGITYPPFFAAATAWSQPQTPRGVVPLILRWFGAPYE